MKLFTVNYTEFSNELVSYNDDDNEENGDGDKEEEEEEEDKSIVVFSQVRV